MKMKELYNMARKVQSNGIRLLIKKSLKPMKEVRRGKGPTPIFQGNQDTPLNFEKDIYSINCLKWLQHLVHFPLKFM